MNSADCEISILTDIDQMIVAYERAKKYLENISKGLQEQIEIWSERQRIIKNNRQRESLDFLTSRTNQITELTIKTVETLCRADLLLEQIRRIDPKSLQNQNNLHQPSVRQISNSSSISGSSHGPTSVEQNRPADFFAHDRQPFQSRLNSPFNSITNPPGIRPDSRSSNFTSDDRSKSPAMQNFVAQRPELFSKKQKVRVPLQKIRVKCDWPRAKVEVVDSIFAFYVRNLEKENHYEMMFNEMNSFYRQSERKQTLTVVPSQKLGDFGVATYSKDGSWRRARYLKKVNNIRVKIVFIDYGEVEDILPNKFFVLNSKFCELPAQVIACTLSKAYPQNGSDDSICPEDLNEAFRNLVQDKEARVSFHFDEKLLASWPLNFVDLVVNNQSVQSSLAHYLRAPMQNSEIAERLAPMITEMEQILFNVNTEN